MVYALMGNRARSLGYFRSLIDRIPSAWERCRPLREVPKLRQSIDGQPGFAQAS